jgi:hypothetical protein
VHFIFHDRVSFGGTLMAIGTLYLWLVAFPLRFGDEWAWWTILLLGVIGFVSFLTYLIYGYLDTWHAVASLFLLPLFLGGIWKTRALLPLSGEGWRSLIRPGMPLALGTRAGFGRACLLFVGVGMTAAGLVIAILGSTVVFVPQDITYLGFTPAQLTAINPHLVPLIAHDRAGFGGWLASCGLMVFLISWKARPALALWQGTAGRRVDRLWLCHRGTLPDGVPQHVPPRPSVDRRSDLRGWDCLRVPACERFRSSPWGASKQG